jgi:hypothetical protein
MWFARRGHGGGLWRTQSEPGERAVGRGCRRPLGVSRAADTGEPEAVSRDLRLTQWQDALAIAERESAV